LASLAWLPPRMALESADPGVRSYGFDRAQGWRPGREASEQTARRSSCWNCELDRLQRGRCPYAPPMAAPRLARCPAGAPAALAECRLPAGPVRWCPGRARQDRLQRDAGPVPGRAMPRRVPEPCPAARPAPVRVCPGDHRRRSWRRRAGTEVSRCSFWPCRLPRAKVDGSRTVCLVACAAPRHHPASVPFPWQARCQMKSSPCAARARALDRRGRGENLQASRGRDELARRLVAGGSTTFPNPHERG
jgi:hypothetical protein